VSPAPQHWRRYWIDDGSTELRRFRQGLKMIGLGRLIAILSLATDHPECRKLFRQALVGYVDTLGASQEKAEH
jgi:hypothetical protein